MAKIMIMATGAMMVYHHRLELINRFRSLGWSVVVCAPASPEAATLEKVGCSFIDTPLETRGKNLLKDMALTRNLAKAIRQERPDVILTFYTKTNIYGAFAAQITDTPYITNVTGMGSAIENGGIMQKFMLTLYKAAVRKTSCLFFQNTYNQDFFTKHGIRPGFGRLIPGSGVSLERFSPLPYPESDDIPEFLFVSRILKEKGIDQYIDAAREIKRLNPKAVFHVVGPCDNKYLIKLQDLDKVGVIKYHGKQMDTHQFLKKCHCVVFPSYYSEGMANVLLEGAASCRPLITTDRPGCRETVEDGVTGYLVKERDSGDLIAKIKQFLSLSLEEKKEMGIKGREKMKKEFDREIIVDAYVEEINNVFAHSRN